MQTCTVSKGVSCGQITIYGWLVSPALELLKKRFGNIILCWGAIGSALKSGPVRFFRYFWENRDRDRFTIKGNSQITELKLIKTAKNRS
jgi:hypothetical protein